MELDAAAVSGALAAIRNQLDRMREAVLASVGEAESALRTAAAPGAAVGGGALGAAVAGVRGVAVHAA